MTDVQLEPHQQLLLLRDVTRRTGLINNVQETHLRRWPILVFPGYTTVCKADVPGKTVLFEVSKTRRGATYHKDAPENLAQWTKFLFGDDWAVTIFFKANKGRSKKLVFKAVAQENPFDNLVKSIERQMEKTPSKQVLTPAERDLLRQRIK